VVFPKNNEDIKKLVKFVAENKILRQAQDKPALSLTARSAGTDMTGGPLTESIVLDFTKHFNHVSVANQKAVSQPGVFYRDFEKETLKRNLLLPCYTASKSLNTVGGMVANNSAGEKTLAYGQTKDYVEELNAVLSDGNEYSFKELTDAELDAKLKLTTFEGDIYRKIFRLVTDNHELIQNKKPKTSKNAAGYLLWEVWDGKKFNLAKLLVGSQGTLGLITKTRLKLIRPKTKSELLVIFLNDLKNLGDLVHTVAQYHPESFESFDNHTFKLAIRFLPGLLRRMKGNAFKLFWQFLPEVWMTITGGLPKLVLIAEFTGDNEREIFERLEVAKAVVEERFHLRTHITRSEAETQKYWIVRRESFSLLRQHSKGLSTAPFIDDIVVRPHQLPEFLPQLDSILNKYPSLIYTIAGHMGDANFHIIPLMDLSKKDQRDIIPKLADEVYNLVLKYGGSITAEHNDGLIRTPYLEKMFGKQMTKLFLEVKNIFDPKNIFNPRKKVGGDLAYTLAHIQGK
jgi:FAD/FMN-containing dehydrogenase